MFVVWKFANRLRVKVAIYKDIVSRPDRLIDTNRYLDESSDYTKRHPGDKSEWGQPDGLCPEDVDQAVALLGEVPQLVITIIPINEDEPEI